METLKVKVKNSIKNITVKEKKIFDWKVETESKIDELYTEITFSRDDKVEYYSDLKNLENEYNKRNIIPFFPIPILAIITFALLTLFAIFGVIKKDIISFNTAMLCFLLPGGISAFILGAYAVVYTKQLLADANGQEEKNRLYLEKVEGLKHHAK